MSKFILGYVGAVTSAVSIAVGSLALFITSDSFLLLHCTSLTLFPLVSFPLSSLPLSLPPLPLPFSRVIMFSCIIDWAQCSY